MIEVSKGDTVDKIGYTVPAGCFLDKIRHRCFHLRQDSAEALARISSRSVLDIIGLESEQRPVRIGICPHKKKMPNKRRTIHSLGHFFHFLCC